MNHMEEMIPLSANIFHAKGDRRARALAAIDIVLACLPDVFTDQIDAENSAEWAGMLKTLLTPAGYDVRAGELTAALDGRDTLPPQEAQAGGFPLVVGWDGKVEGATMIGVFSSVSSALEAGAKYTEEYALDVLKK